MTLTKERVEAIEIGGRDDEWEMSGNLSMDDARELRRLALLGLDLEERRKPRSLTDEERAEIERVDAILHPNGRYCEHGRLGPYDCDPCGEAFLAEERERERAERIGRAVLEVERDQKAVHLRARANMAASRGSLGYASLLRAIADAMEDEP